MPNYLQRTFIPVLEWDNQTAKYLVFKCLVLECPFFGSPLYSGGSNSEHSNTESIRKPNISKFGFRKVEKQNGGHFVRFSKGQPFENRTFQNGRFSLGSFIYKDNLFI